VLSLVLIAVAAGGFAVTAHQVGLSR
jgi:hypothetical protein